MSVQVSLVDFFSTIFSLRNKVQYIDPQLFIGPLKNHAIKKDVRAFTIQFTSISCGIFKLLRALLVL